MRNVAFIFILLRTCMSRSYLDARSRKVKHLFAFRFAFTDVRVYYLASHTEVTWLTVTFFCDVSSCFVWTLLPIAEGAVLGAGRTESGPGENRTEPSGSVRGRELTHGVLTATLLRTLLQPCPVCRGHQLGILDTEV